MIVGLNITLDAGFPQAYSLTVLTHERSVP